MRFEVHKSQPTNEETVTRPEAASSQGQRRTPALENSYPGSQQRLYSEAGAATSTSCNSGYYRTPLADSGNTDGDRRFSESDIIDEEVEKIEQEKEDRLLLEDENNSTQRSTQASNERSVKSASAAPYAHIGRLYAKRQTWRLVYKDGTCNVTSKNVSRRRKRYLVDIFTTFVDMKWRYNVTMFGIAFIGTWLFFGLIWWGTAVLNGDHLHENDEHWEFCVDGVYSFLSALLFSIETQQTIGYGTRAVSSKCTHGAFILMLQSCVGVFIQSLTTGLIFAKLSRPKGRAQTLMFSRQAVICQRDGAYCLLFRLGDMRKSHIIGTSIRALIVKNRITREGEMIPLCQYNLKLETETDFSDGFVFLVWPVTVVHRIDETSPLWEISAESLLSEHFEIIVILEGNLESTGNSAQFRTSYLPTEILWGQRLAPLFTYQKGNGQYEIDFTQFHKTLPVDSMPSFSAKENDERCRKEGTPSREPDRYFPANFTVQASDSRSTSRYQAFVRRRLSRVKRLSLTGSVPTAEPRRSVDNTNAATAAVTVEPKPKRSKHLSENKSEPHTPICEQRRSLRNESGSEAGFSVRSSNNNNSRSESEAGSEIVTENSITTRKRPNGVNLYAMPAITSRS